MCVWTTIVKVTCVLAVAGQTAHPQVAGVFGADAMMGRLQRNAMRLRNRITNRIMQHRQRYTTEVCYDLVGCFQVPHSRSPLQKAPESPAVLDTKFFLFRRNINFSEPTVLRYEDGGASLNQSSFDPTHALKIYIHGYMSKWSERGALIFADSHLKLLDCNIIVMDWTLGARGPQYTTAAANTEIVGRQLGILLKMMIDRGLDPKRIHLVGFSLGAHVAGCASELLKKDNLLIGRITGLDAASPLFRTENLKEKYKKLDREDADFVDVLHTDSSPIAVDGFGLWEPIGHVDFFANGGREQPGCIDKKPSIIVSHFEGALTRDTACSHIRAYHLFLETIVNRVKNVSCEFLAFRCKGPSEFERGECFPILDLPNNSLALNRKYNPEMGVLGEYAEGSGVLYFVTNAQSPFCGTQLQAQIRLSYNSEPIRGIIQMEVESEGVYAGFYMQCELRDVMTYPTQLHALAASSRELNTDKDPLVAHIRFVHLESTMMGIQMAQHLDMNLPKADKVLKLDRIQIRDFYGNSWFHCGSHSIYDETVYLNSTGPLSLKLRKKFC